MADSIFKGNEPHMEGIGPSSYLIGLINAFNNRFQAAGDTFFDELSWRQVFALNCVSFFENPPTIKDMAEMMGGSHQNTKQILSKLEKYGFVILRKDESDGRKQRIVLTEKAAAFLDRYTEGSSKFMQGLFQEIDSQELEATIRVINQLDDKLKKYQQERILTNQIGL